MHEAEGNNGDKAMVGDENVSMQYACKRRGHVEEEAQPGHKRMTWRMSSASSGSSRRWRSDDIWRRAADETSGRRSEQRDCEGTDFCVGNDYGRGSLISDKPRRMEENKQVVTVLLVCRVHVHVPHSTPKPP